MNHRPDSQLPFSDTPRVTESTVILSLRGVNFEDVDPDDRIELTFDEIKELLDPGPQKPRVKFHRAKDHLNEESNAQFFVKCVKEGTGRATDSPSQHSLGERELRAAQLLYTRREQYPNIVRYLKAFSCTLNLGDGAAKYHFFIQPALGLSAWKYYGALDRWLNAQLGSAHEDAQRYVNSQIGTVGLALLRDGLRAVLQANDARVTNMDLSVENFVLSNRIEGSGPGGEANEQRNMGRFAHLASIEFDQVKPKEIAFTMIDFGYSYEIDRAGGITTDVSPPGRGAGQAPHRDRTDEHQGLIHMAQQVAMAAHTIALRGNTPWVDKDGKRIPIQDQSKTPDPGWTANPDDTALEKDSGWTTTQIKLLRDIVITDDEMYWAEKTSRRTPQMTVMLVKSWAERAGAEEHQGATDEYKQFTKYGLETTPQIGLDTEIDYDSLIHIEQAAQQAASFLLPNIQSKIATIADFQPESPEKQQAEQAAKEREKFVREKKEKKTTRRESRRNRGIHLRWGLIGITVLTGATVYVLWPLLYSFGKLPSNYSNFTASQWWGVAGTTLLTMFGAWSVHNSFISKLDEPQRSGLQTAFADFKIRRQRQAKLLRWMALFCFACAAFAGFSCVNLSGPVSFEAHTGTLNWMLGISVGATVLGGVLAMRFQRNVWTWTPRPAGWWMWTGGTLLTTIGITIILAVGTSTFVMNWYSGNDAKPVDCGENSYVDNNGSDISCISQSEKDDWVVTDYEVASMTATDKENRQLSPLEQQAYLNYTFAYKEIESSCMSANLYVTQSAAADFYRSHYPEFGAEVQVTPHMVSSPFAKERPIRFKTGFNTWELYEWQESTNDGHTRIRDYRLTNSWQTRGTGTTQAYLQLIERDCGTVERQLYKGTPRNLLNSIQLAPSMYLDPAFIQLRSDAPENAVTASDLSTRITGNGSYPTSGEWPDSGDWQAAASFTHKNRPMWVTLNLISDGERSESSEWEYSATPEPHLYWYFTHDNKLWCVVAQAPTVIKDVPSAGPEYEKRIEYALRKSLNPVLKNFQVFGKPLSKETGD